MSNQQPTNLVLCGVPVQFCGAAVLPQYLPLLYEWRIYAGNDLTCLYIGKARGGQSRPFKTYPKVVADLSQSRGKKKIFEIPKPLYFQRNPWGFRWIHHQLEAAAARITNGNALSERIDLSFLQVGISIAALHKTEQAAIAAAKATYAGTTILANGEPSMRCQYMRSRSRLDSVWV